MEDYLFKSFRVLEEIQDANRSGKKRWNCNEGVIQIQMH